MHWFIFCFPLQTTQNGRNDGIPSYRLNGNITKVALEMLVEYAYTAQLIVPDALVKDVYLAAWQLRIETIINKCTRHLIDELTADSCIEIRSLPGINKNIAFAGVIDDYISKEVHSIQCDHPKRSIFLKIFMLNLFSVRKCFKNTSIPAIQLRHHRCFVSDQIRDGNCNTSIIVSAGARLAKATNWRGKCCIW